MTDSENRFMKEMRKIPGIDPDEALKTTLTVATLKEAMNVYCDTAESKIALIRQYHMSRDWEKYVIEVHGLKSASRMIGAMQLGDFALELEMAGKSGDIVRINEKTDRLLKDYEDIYLGLKSYFEKDGAEEKTADDRPAAPAQLLDGVFRAAYEAIDNYDNEQAVEELLKLEPYALSKADKELVEAIKRGLAQFDNDLVLELIKNRNN